MLKRAYAPYSHFPVGAALLTGSERIFQGSNIENAAYPSGLCAEPAAIGQMMIAPLGPMPIRADYIASKEHSSAWPCGSCRQRLNEFASPTMWVYTATLAGSPKRMAFSDLLPNSFEAADLQVVRSVRLSITQRIDLLDLTRLEDVAGDEEVIEALCARADVIGYLAAACVHPAYVALAKGLLQGGSVAIATVVNIPGGEQSIWVTQKKVGNVLADGAEEIDVVVPNKAWLAEKHSAILTLLEAM